MKTKSYLFVGGPWNGERHDVPSDHTFYRVPCSDPLVLSVERPLCVPRHETAVYHKRRIRFGASVTAVHLFVEAGLSEYEVDMLMASMLAPR